MKTTLLLFGKLTEYDTSGKIELEVESDSFTTEDLKILLQDKYPGIQNTSYRVAVNHEFANGDTWIKTTDEIALLPPFSGG
jgi:molybdopterin converting factor small subunit